MSAVYDVNIEISILGDFANECDQTEPTDEK
jgi:hypothetical protein